MRTRILNENFEIIDNTNIPIEIDMEFNNFQLSEGKGMSYEEYKEKFPLVSRIDLYSDTIITYGQKDLYIEEFKRINKLTNNSGLKIFCNSIVNCLENLNFRDLLMFEGDQLFCFKIYSVVFITVFPGSPRK